jgi:hypothetical protein
MELKSDLLSALHDNLDVLHNGYASKQNLIHWLPFCTFAMIQSQKMFSLISASYFSFSRHFTLAVAIWVDELILVMNYHSRSVTHLGAQEVWLLSMTGSGSRTN